MLLGIACGFVWFMFGGYFDLWLILFGVLLLGFGYLFVFVSVWCVVGLIGCCVYIVVWLNCTLIYLF